MSAEGEKPPISERATMEALHCYAFVSQLDAPVLHRAFTVCGDLLLECVEEIDRLRAKLEAKQ